jgi:hypothetical protein
MRDTMDAMPVHNDELGKGTSLINPNVRKIS